MRHTLVLCIALSACAGPATTTATPATAESAPGESAPTESAPTETAPEASEGAPATEGSEPTRSTEAGSATEPVSSAEITPASCTDPDGASRAVSLTLAHASAEHGVSAGHLGDCSFDPSAPCDGASAPAADFSAALPCRVSVSRESGFWHVEVRPRAATGAPIWLEANLDPAAPDPPARFWASASTWMVAATTFHGVDSRISHAHGRGASISSATFVANNPRGPLPIQLRQVQWLSSADCELPTGGRTLDGINFRVGDVESPGRHGTLPSGESTITVTFEPVEAAYSYCDRYAARATFRVDATTMTITAEWLVSRRSVVR